MSSNNSNSDDNAGVGCLILGLIVVGAPMIIAVVNALIYAAAIGGVAFLGYRAYIFDQRTGKITALFEKAIDSLSGNSLPASDTQNLIQGEDGTFGLPTGEVDQDKENFKSDLDEIREEMDRLKLRNQELEYQTRNSADEAVRKYASEAEHRAKGDALRRIYGEDTPLPETGYARSDEYEKQKYQKELEKKEERIEIREIRVDINEQIAGQNQKILGQDQKIMNVEGEMRQGFLHVEGQMMNMQHEYREGLMRVMETVQTLKSYVDERFTRIEVHIEKQLSGVREMVIGLRAELKEDLSKTRLQFSQEILRIDKQQTVIVGKLGEYESRLKGFSAEMSKMRQDAQHFAWEGKRVLQQAELINQRHSLTLQKASNDLELGLKEISVHKGDFANRVGRAKVMMDEISNEQYFTLKNIGHERLGVEMLRQDYTSRQEKEELKLGMIRQDINNTSVLIQERMKRGEDVQRLNHQLSMSREREASTSQRLGIMREENALVRRLS